MSLKRSTKIRYRTIVKERPTPTFAPISCIGSKFTWMSAHPGASFAWLMECTCGVWEAPFLDQTLPHSTTLYPNSTSLYDTLPRLYLTLPHSTLARPDSTSLYHTLPRLYLTLYNLQNAATYCGGLLLLAFSGNVLVSSYLFTDILVTKNIGNIQGSDSILKWWD